MSNGILNYLTGSVMSIEQLEQYFTAPLQFFFSPFLFPFLKASISCNSAFPFFFLFFFFSNAGTTTVTSGPAFCHETALGLAENQSADCLHVCGFYHSAVSLQGLRGQLHTTQSAACDAARAAGTDLSLTLHSALLLLFLHTLIYSSYVKIVI